MKRRRTLRHPSFVVSLAEAIEATRARGGRSLLTAVGISIAVALLISVMGLSASADRAVRAEFDALRASKMAVTYSPSAPEKYVSSVRRERLLRLPGVISAGMRSKTSSSEILVSRLQDGVGEEATIFAIEPEALSINDLVLVSGRFFDAGNVLRHDRVALVGVVLARELLAHQTRAGDHPQRVMINGTSTLIMGIYDTSDPILAASVVIPFVNPSNTASSTKEMATFPGKSFDSLDFDPPQWNLQIEPGSGENLLKSVPLALLPENPDLVTPLLAYEATELRERVQSTVSQLVLVLVVVAGVVGGMVIRNAMQIAVLQRRGEIGLRRALGERRSAIAIQFTMEGSILGFMGCIIGVPVGILICILYPLLKGEPPELPWVVILMSLPISIAIGALAAFNPAVKAARVEPLDALRS